MMNIYETLERLTVMVDNQLSKDECDYIISKMGMSEIDMIIVDKLTELMRNCENTNQYSL